MNVRNFPDKVKAHLASSLLQSLTEDRSDDWPASERLGLFYDLVRELQPIELDQTAIRVLQGRRGG